MKNRRLLFVLAALLVLATPGLALLQVGDPAPNFSIPDSTGTMRQLSEFRGQVVHILFWANF